MALPTWGYFVSDVSFSPSGEGSLEVAGSLAAALSQVCQHTAPEKGKEVSVDIILMM